MRRDKFSLSRRLVLAAAFCTGATTLALAHSLTGWNCGPWPVLSDTPATAGQVVVGLGITHVGWLVERWENPATGGWALTMRSPTGLLCLIATGGRWQRKGEPT